MKKNVISKKAITLLVLVAVLLFGAVGCDSSNNNESNKDKPITVVWYPNESANDYDDTREEVGRLIEQATGRKVEQKLTTDYVIAIEAIASGSADIAMAMGAVGYIEAKTKNPQVDVLFVNSGASGTLDDAIYYAWLCVNVNDAASYLIGGDYAIEDIKGKRMSFVSNSSTSGFKVPTAGIIDFFESDELTVDDLVEGGSNAFFKEVLFGGSHQGSAFNLISGKADVAAFCDIELQPYIDLKSGEENRVGSIYGVKSDASAPFDTVHGKEFVVIASTPVLNGPNAYNPKNLSAEEIKAIRDLFTSAEVTNNAKIFYNPDTDPVGLYKISSSHGYVLVDDSWYNPIREMGNQLKKVNYMSIVEFQNVSKVYNNTTQALTDVSFSIKEGEFVSIIGPSGSGKSTILRCINRLVDATQGTIVFDDHDITKADKKKIRQIRKKTGMIFQHYNLVDRLSVIENVLHGRLGHKSTFSGCAGWYTEEEKTQAFEIIEKMGLTEQAYKRCDELSGGQKQRVGIARSIMQNPRLILCDEPIASLDPSASKVIMDHLSNINKVMKITCIFNLHQVDVAMKYSQRIIGLTMGKIVYDGPPKKLSKKKIYEIYQSNEGELITDLKQRYERR